MEKRKITKEDLSELKDAIIFLVLFGWMIMPVIQTIRQLYTFIDIEDWYFTLMKITAGVGIGISIFWIFDKIKNAERKKEVLKEISPIFIFVLFMGWTLISCFLSPNKFNAFNGHFYRNEGYYMYINYAGYFLCAFLLKDKGLRKTLLNGFIMTTIFLIVISRLPYYGIRTAKIFVNNSIDTTVFAHLNHYGYYLMIALACSLGLFITEKNKIMKIVYVIAFTIIGYAMIYNDTFGCYLAISITLILYAIYALIKKTDRRAIFTAITIFVLLSCVTTKDNRNLAYTNISEFAYDVKAVIYKIMNKEIEPYEAERNEQYNITAEGEVENFQNIGTSRMLLWTKGIDFVLESPIIGYGPDNLGPMYLELWIPHDRPHNLLIYLAAVSGIPGMLIYVTAVGIILVKGIKNLLKNNKQGTLYLIVVITYLISSMFGNSMFYTSPYFFIFLGSLMHFNLRKQEE